MPTATCPHCHREIEAPAELAGQVVTCPHRGCGRELTLPSQARAPSFAPARRETSQRKSNDGLTQMLLGGLLICNVAIAIMFATWEVRYQVFRSNMQDAVQQIQRKSKI